MNSGLIRYDCMKKRESEGYRGYVPDCNEEVVGKQLIMCDAQNDPGLNSGQHIYKCQAFQILCHFVSRCRLDNRRLNQFC